MPRIRTYNALHLFLGASTLALSGPAFAQTEASSDTGLADIVVTAQKRAQNLQEVPIAISAISADKIEQLSIKDSRDLSGLAPNVTVVPGTTTNSAAVFSMRGISNGGSESFGIDAANGLYVDGVYIARSGAMGLDVMDVERVEVLRGPQGTLFGRNTTGGALAFISRAPSSDFRLKAEAGYGNYDAWNGKIVLDPGQIAGIATSFSYSHSQRNGIIDNILQPKDSKDPGGRKSDAFRIAARSDLGSTGSIQYIFDWSRVNGTPMPFQLTNVADGTVRPAAVVNGQQVVVTQQAPVQQYLASVAFGEPGCEALAVPAREYRHQICNNILSNAVDKTWGHNLQFQNDFGAFKIKSTTGYRLWRSSSVTDLDGMGTITGPAFTNASLFNGMPESLLASVASVPAAYRSAIANAAVPTTTQGLYDVSNNRRHKQFSHELEISGDSQNFDWVVGGFYFWERGSENGRQNSGYVVDTNAVLSNPALGLDASVVDGLIVANPVRYRLRQTLSSLIYSTTSESTALYGQFTLYPGGRDSGIRLTAGGRYTWDEKSLVRYQNGETAPATVEGGEAKFSKFTWNLMAGYDIADRVNVYARAATGYRSGGFNSQDSAIPGTSVLPNFQPENVTSYEIGLKSELFGRRLRFNVAGYHNIYKDLAVNVPRTDAPVGNFSTRIGNAGKVTYTGVEAEAQAILTDNFSIDGNIGYIDVKYKEFMAGQSPVSGSAPINIASVVVPSYTSPLTANVALNAQFPLNGDATLRARIGYTHEDGKYSFTTNISSPYNNELKSSARDIVDAQLGVDGIQFGGAKGEVRLWVKNLTNGKDFVRGVDFGPLGFAGLYLGEPRTYGITLGIKM